MKEILSLRVMPAFFHYQTFQPLDKLNILSNSTLLVPHPSNSSTLPTDYPHYLNSPLVPLIPSFFLSPIMILMVHGITADGDCIYKITRCLLLGRKVMTNLDSILKSRDITLSTKVRLVKAMVFPVVMYGRECWTIKKAECRRIDAFELWCWRRL